MAESLQVTPLHAIHTALGARMMAFGGFDMPVQYTSILDEHRAVREAAGLFDVSHMGEVRVTGPQAFDYVQYLVTNDVSKLYDGKALYSVMCQHDGGAVDDLLVYAIAEQEYLLVINASNIDKDLAHMEAVLAESGFDAALTDESAQTALLALQGPASHRIFEALLASEGVPFDLGGLKYYHFATVDGLLGMGPLLVSHTGYTGEQGLELYADAAHATRLWNALVEAGEAHGLQPAGLGARDTLRLEAGYCLYGHELTETINPLEAGLGWVVKLNAGDFVGREALAQQKTDGLSRKLVGFVMDERAIPRQGHGLATPDGEPIGEVTSGSQSPTLGRGIGLGFVPNDPAYTKPGSAVHVSVRNRLKRGTVRKPPFHKL
ncbi:MAG: glycine cleavage system aminomethyltransferase GcvT [Bacteroidota bacterium]